MTSLVEIGPVFNAENLTTTDKGRIFVTGSEAVYEIGTNDDNSFKINAVPVSVEAVPEKCMKNGIVAYGDSLYLACAHIHKGNNPFLPVALCNTSEVEQNPISVIWLYSLSTICQVDSYIVRADLNQTPLEFTDLVAKLPNKFLANGLDIDEKGEFLYVTNSLSNAYTGIYKVPVQGSTKEDVMSPWHSSGSTPNGIKVKDNYVYYTGHQFLPVMSAVLGRLEIRKDGDPGQPEVIYRRFFSTFDDFDITDRGFIIAIFSDLSDLSHFLSFTQMGSGCLVFVTQDGKAEGIWKRIRHPSAVEVVNGNNHFDDGDIFITDKDKHCVFWLRPNDARQEWLKALPPSYTVIKPRSLQSSAGRSASYSTGNIASPSKA